jgi:hypothetical protein
MQLERDHRDCAQPFSPPRRTNPIDLMSLSVLGNRPARATKLGDLRRLRSNHQLASPFTLSPSSAPALIAEFFARRLQSICDASAM